MEFKQVKSFGFSRITNAYHVAFFSTFRAIINEHGAERLNLPGEIVDEFSDLLDAEEIVVNRSLVKKVAEHYARGIGSKHLKELDVEDERGTSRNRTVVVGAISEVIWNIETELGAFGHILQAFGPAFDYARKWESG